MTRRPFLVSVVALAALLGAASPASAEPGLVLAETASLDLGSATLDLGCGSLDVAGTLHVGDGAIAQALDVDVPIGGVLNGGTGVIEVTGDWTRSGTFSAGTGTVSFRDGCGTALSVIAGPNAFANLSITSSAGKEYRLEAGATQSVSSQLTIVGAAGSPLVLRSTLGGTEAVLDVQAASWAAFLDVDDVHATPNPITTGPGAWIGTNATGWLLAQLPALSLVAIAVLALALVRAGRRSLRGDAGRTPPR